MRFTRHGDVVQLRVSPERVAFVGDCKAIAISGKEKIFAIVDPSVCSWVPVDV